MPTVVPAIVANHAGWVAAEVGRQPWIVHPAVNWTGDRPGDGDVVVGPDGLVRYDEGANPRSVGGG